MLAVVYPRKQRSQTSSITRHGPARPIMRPKETPKNDLLRFDCDVLMAHLVQAHKLKPQAVLSIGALCVLFSTCMQACIGMSARISKLNSSPKGHVNTSCPTSIEVKLHNYVGAFPMSLLSGWTSSKSLQIPTPGSHPPRCSKVPKPWALSSALPSDSQRRAAATSPACNRAIANHWKTICF